MRELAPGLWDWQAAHPEWSAEASWPEVVSSHAYDDGERLLLFDPLDVPAEITELATQRETAIVLTAPWHERDTQRLVGEHALPVYAPRPDTAQDLIDTFGVGPEQVEGFVSSDLRWLLHDGDASAYHPVSADEPPFGLTAFAGRTRNDLVYWLEGPRAVVSGDTLSDFGPGLVIRSEWLSAKVTREEVAARLRPLLALPVEHVLPAHGLPTGRAALERALA